MDEKYYLKVGRAADLENPKERRLYRFLEMIVGITSLLILFLAVILSWKFPIWVAFFIIVYDFYFLLRTIYFAFYLKDGYSKMRKNEHENWIKKLEGMGAPQNGINVQSYREIYHLIVLPTFREPIEVVRTTMNCLVKTDYPKDKMIVVLACEEADRENAEKFLLKLKKIMATSFLSS